MFVLPGKYKTLLIGSLLLAYMASNFHRPFLDGLHYFSHLTQEFLIPFENQSHTHDEPHAHPHVHDDYQHPVISTLSQILAWFSEEPDTEHNSKKPLKKKHPELKSVTHPVALFHNQDRSKPVNQPDDFQSFFPTTPTPPPKG